MKKTAILSAAVLALAFASCGGNSENKTEKDDANRPLSAYEIEQRMKDSLAKLPPKPMTFDEALADTLSIAHNVSIEGYLQLPPAFFHQRPRPEHEFLRPSQPDGWQGYLRHHSHRIGQK